MKKNIVKILSLFLLSSMMLLGCESNNSKVDESSKEKFTIVTSFYPIYISTLNVVKDVPNVEVINMTKAQTGCLHDYQLTPEDLKIVNNADVFIMNGAGMESFIDKVIDSNKDMKVINASEGIELLHSEEEHDHHHIEGEEHDHSHGTENGHVWVSVSNTIKQVENIKNGLVDANEENATIYKVNAEAYEKELENLKMQIHQELDNTQNKNIVTFHESFSYFAKEFGLNVVAVINMEDGREPSAKKKEEIIKEIKENNVKALFTEPQYESKAAISIANETGTKVYELNPIATGDSNPSAINDYINIMKENLKVLKEALN